MTATQKPEMTDAFVLGGVRTPFARYGSSLSAGEERPLRRGRRVRRLRARRCHRPGKPQRDLMSGFGEKPQSRTPARFV